MDLQESKDEASIRLRRLSDSPTATTEPKPELPLHTSALKLALAVATPVLGFEPPTPQSPRTAWIESPPAAPAPAPTSSLRKRLSQTILKTFGQTIPEDNASYDTDTTNIDTPLPTQSPIPSLSASPSLSPQPAPTTPSQRSHSPSSSLSSLKSLIATSPGVRLTLINQTSAPIQLAAWPVPAEDDGDSCPMQAWKGNGVIERKVPEPWKTYEAGEMVALGVLRVPEKEGFTNSHSNGWIFFDILLPPSNPRYGPYRIHCQAFLRLSTSGNAPKTGLGRFDLDSSKDRPMPSGRFGRVEVVTREGSSRHHHRRASSDAGKGHGRGTSVDLAGEKGEEGEVTEVRYFLTPDVLEVRNEVDDSTNPSKIWLPSKRLSVSSWVSCGGARVEIFIDEDARYHEHHASLIHPKEMRTTHHELDGVKARNCFLMVTHEGERVFERWVKINPALNAVLGPLMVSTRRSVVVFDLTRNITINAGSRAMVGHSPIPLFSSSFYNIFPIQLISGFAIPAEIVDSKTGRPTALSMVPTVEELATTLERAREGAAGLAARDIVIGRPEDLKRTIGSLIATNTRLIIADRVHTEEGQEGRWEREDSYHHESYDTDDPTKVMAALKAAREMAITRSAKKVGPEATIYQLQASSTLGNANPTVYSFGFSHEI
ncbi:hypothetical protein P7C70_g8144, partial [Phenoliferia sp. Uapishka_3]